MDEHTPVMGLYLNKLGKVVLGASNAVHGRALNSNAQGWQPLTSNGTPPYSIPIHCPMSRSEVDGDRSALGGGTRIGLSVETYPTKH